MGINSAALFSYIRSLQIRAEVFKEQNANLEAGVGELYSLGIRLIFEVTRGVERKATAKRCLDRIPRICICRKETKSQRNKKKG